MVTRHAGFTLIELLIVILLMAALTFMGIGSYMSSQRKSRDTRRKNDLQEVAKALDMYINDYGDYPSSDDATGKMLACDDGATLCEWGDSWYRRTGGRMTTYMQNLPKDPSAGQIYWYQKLTGETGYLLYARFENADDAAGYDEHLGIIGGITANCGKTATLPCTYVLRSVNLTPTPTPIP